MPKVLRVDKDGKTEFVRSGQPTALPADLNAKVAVIQALIPLGLKAVEEALQQEVAALAGLRYARGGGHPGHVRWSREPVSVSIQRLSPHTRPPPTPGTSQGEGTHGPLAGFQRMSSGNAHSDPPGVRLLARHSIPRARTLLQEFLAQMVLRPDGTRLAAVVQEYLGTLLGVDSRILGDNCGAGGPSGRFLTEVYDPPLGGLPSRWCERSRRLLRG